MAQLVLDEEVPFTGGTMVSETDLGGSITYCNRLFVEMSGYEKSELMGNSHNVLRHPDMPKAIFKEMWATIQTGEPWKGYIKNLRKDGAYYWAIVYISQTHDESGYPKGYISMREVPGPQTLEKTKEDYKQMLEEEK